MSTKQLFINACQVGQKLECIFTNVLNNRRLATREQVIIGFG